MKKIIIIPLSLLEILFLGDISTPGEDGFVALSLPACVWWVVGGRVNDGRGWMSFRGGRRTSRTEGRIRSPNRILVLGNDYGVCKC